MFTSVWCCIFWSLVLITHTTVENILMSCLACHMTPEGKETQSVVCGLGPGHEGFVTETLGNKHGKCLCTETLIAVCAGDTGSKCWGLRREREGEGGRKRERLI